MSTQDDGKGVPNLLTEWIQLRQEQSPELSKTDLINEINTWGQTAYTLTKLGQWRRGESPLPRWVEQRMRNEVLAHIIRELGVDITPRQWQMITKRLRLPIPKNERAGA